MTTKTPTKAAAPLRVGSQASELAAVHSDGGIVGDTLASITAWSDAAEALRALDASPRPTPPGDPAETVTACLLDAVRSGAGVPDGIEETATRAAVSATAYAALIAGRDGARTELVAELDTAVRGNWHTLFAALDAELQSIIEAAREVSSLSDLADAETAISADRVSDFQRWRSLLGRHAAVRATQSRLLRHAGAIEGASHPEAMFLRGAEDGFEDWRAWRTHGHLINPRTKQRKTITPPWPTNDSGRLTVDVAGSEPFLRWVLGTDASAWIPTPRELGGETARLDVLMHGDTPSRGRVERSAPEAQYVDPSTVTNKRVSI